MPALLISASIFPYVATAAAINARQADSDDTSVLSTSVCAPNAAHWLAVFRTFYGPMHKAFAALDASKQEALTADLLALAEKFNRAKDGTLVAPSEYLEVVIKRK